MFYVHDVYSHSYVNQTKEDFEWGGIPCYASYDDGEEPSSTGFVPLIFHVVITLALAKEDYLSSKHRCWCDAPAGHEYRNPALPLCPIPIVFPGRTKARRA